MLEIKDAAANVARSITAKATEKERENLTNTLTDTDRSKPIKMPHHCPMCEYHGRTPGGLNCHLMYVHPKHEVIKCLIATLAKLMLCIESSTLLHLEE